MTIIYKFDTIQLAVRKLVLQLEDALVPFYQGGRVDTQSLHTKVKKAVDAFLIDEAVATPSEEAGGGSGDQPYLEALVRYLRQQVDSFQTATLPHIEEIILALLRALNTNAQLHHLLTVLPAGFMSVDITTVASLYVEYHSSGAGGGGIEVRADITKEVARQLITTVATQTGRDALDRIVDWAKLQLLPPLPCTGIVRVPVVRERVVGGTLAEQSANLVVVLQQLNRGSLTLAADLKAAVQPFITGAVQPPTMPRAVSVQERDDVEQPLMQPPVAPAISTIADRLDAVAGRDGVSTLELVTAITTAQQELPQVGLRPPIVAPRLKMWGTVTTFCGGIVGAKSGFTYEENWLGLGTDASGTIGVIIAVISFIALMCLLNQKYGRQHANVAMTRQFQVALGVAWQRETETAGPDGGDAQALEGEWAGAAV